MKLSRKISLTLVSLAIAWPPVHMALSRTLGFSSWRLFGWGMYAEPHPEQMARLRWISKDPIVGVDPIRTPQWLEIYRVSADGKLLRQRVVPRAAAERARRALHFPSLQTAKRLADSQSQWLIIHTKQRLDVREKEAFSQSRAFSNGPGRMEALYHDSRNGAPTDLLTLSLR